MANNVTYALVLVLSILFNMYIMALMARLLLQLGRANPFNPITRAIITITKPPVSLCQHFIPTVKNVDFAVLFVTFLITIIKIYLMAGIAHGVFLSNFTGVAVWTLGDIFSTLVNLFFYAIIIQIIASWIASGQYSPGIEVVHHIANPIISPFQRLIPSLGGLDISPIFAILLLKASEAILVWPLISTGKALAIS